MLIEHGYDFFVVDDRCQFWVLNYEGAGSIRRGTLTDGDIQTISDSLQLSQWLHHAGSYECNWFDGPWWNYQFRGVSVHSDSVGRDWESIEWMIREVHDIIVRLYDRGEPMDGAVRYTLVTHPQLVLMAPDDYYRNSADWPLAISANDLAVHLGEEGWSDSIHQAEGADADSLRAIGRDHRNGIRGNPSTKFSPVVDREGTHYQLFMRDVLPFDASDWSLLTRPR